MRKLKLQVQMSIDGYMAGQDGGMDWLEWNWDEELKNYVIGITEQVDCILLGRKLAENFIDAWKNLAEDPETNDDAARKINDTAKVVFTKTIFKTEWENTTLESGDLVQEVTNLKNQEGKDLIVYGGGTFVRALIDAGLIDELHLFINPTAIGNGMPVFGSLQNMKLRASRSFDCGIVVLCYEPRRA